MAFNQIRVLCSTAVAKLDLKLNGQPSGTLLVALRSLTPDQAVLIATADGQKLSVAPRAVASATDWIQRGVDKSELISPLGAVIEQLAILIRIGDEITKV